MTANTDILQFEFINTILNTLYEHGDSYEFSHPQFKDKTGFYRYAFPTTFTDYPNKEKELKQLQCKSVYDVLNRLYENAGIDKLSEAAIEQSLEYDYLHIQIALPPAPEFKSHFKYQWHHYIIITCFDDDAGDDIRILHTTENLYQYLVALTKAVFIDHKNPAPENTQILNNLVVALEAFCNDFQITTPLNKGIFAKKSDPKADFQELLSILTGGKITKKDAKAMVNELILVEKDPEKLIKELTKDDEEERDHIEHLAENKTDLYQYVLFAYLEGNDYLASSDWKFDPADMEYYVSKLIGKPFPIDCPDETYGSDLFPYVQAQLAQGNKELVNLDSFGDSYGFIVVEKDKVARLVHICNSYGIAMDVL